VGTGEAGWENRAGSFALLVAAMPGRFLACVRALEGLIASCPSRGRSAAPAPESPCRSLPVPVLPGASRGFPFAGRGPGCRVTSTVPGQSPCMSAARGHWGRPPPHTNPHWRGTVRHRGPVTPGRPSTARPPLWAGVRARGTPARPGVQRRPPRGRFWSHYPRPRLKEGGAGPGPGRDRVAPFDAAALGPDEGPDGRVPACACPPPCACSTLLRTSSGSSRNV